MRIVFCLPGKSFSGTFLQCWTALLCECLIRGIEPILSQRFDSNVYYVRTKCLGGDVLRGIHQKPFDGKLTYNRIMWIDSDQVFRPEHFFTLLKHDLDVVGGLYPMEGNQQFAAVKDWDVDYFKKNGCFQFLTRKDMVGLDKPMEVAYTGFGFLMIKHGVIERMEYPWFEPHLTDLGNGIVDFASEDVSFCVKARNQGIQIHIDPTVIVGHEKSQILL